MPPAGREGRSNNGIARLPFLQKGLIAQLAQETHGIAVILEHRYYGDSMPTPDLSTGNLRFLSTDQAVADLAYFAQNIVFPGLEGHNLTAPNVPYIAYGGSYAGALVAFLRVLYPDVYFGAISSSGVTEAIYDYWQYWEPIRQFGPSECIELTQTFTHILDNLFQSSLPSLVKDYEALYGLQAISYANDFASVLSYPLGSWQSRNWDPAINDPSFFQYCDNITSSDIIYEYTASKTAEVTKMIDAGGYEHQSSHLTNKLLNFIGYLNETILWPCLSGGATADECFSTHNSTFYQQDDLSQSWRAWPYQYCTEYVLLPPENK